MESRGKNIWLICVFCQAFFATVWATFGYYRTYTTYGTGDNIVNTLQAHGGAGPNTANRKWNVECLDGEAVIGLIDNFNDFTSIGYVWCKFMMPYKPPSNGIYPFYPNCFTKNFTTQFFCYTPRFHEPSVDSFVVGFYDNEFAFNVYRPYVDDSAPYKCCKAPTGYYIDYSSCYYAPTHDQYWEYYDSPIQLQSGYFMVYCATGYVMTGLAKKAHPMTGEYHIEWLQCCRLGFGAGMNLPPPPPALPSQPDPYATYQKYPTGSGPSFGLSDPFLNSTNTFSSGVVGTPVDFLSGKSRSFYADSTGNIAVKL